MRKRLTTITAATALAAACLAPAAGARPAAIQPTNRPATQHQLPSSGDEYKAGFDGFWAWKQSVQNITDHSAVFTLGYSKEFAKTWLTGVVGVQLYRGDTGQGWVEYGNTVVLDTPGTRWGTTGSRYEDASIPKPTAPDEPRDLPLRAGTTYHFRVFVDYKFERYYSPEGTFTTAG